MDAISSTGIGSLWTEQSRPMWAHAHGRSCGAKLAQLTSDKTRTDALRFYEKLGYQASHEGLKHSL